MPCIGVGYMTLELVAGQQLIGLAGAKVGSCRKLTKMIAFLWHNSELSFSADNS